MLGLCMSLTARWFFLHDVGFLDESAGYLASVHSSEREIYGRHWPYGLGFLMITFHTSRVPISAMGHT